MTEPLKRRKRTTAIEGLKALEPRSPHRQVSETRSEPSPAEVSSSSEILSLLRFLSFSGNYSEIMSDFDQSYEKILNWNKEGIKRHEMFLS